MSERKKPAKRVKRKLTTADILRRLAAMCEEDDVLSEEVGERLTDFLDDMLDDDVFGTEGQNDPRGDRRDS